MKKSLFLWLLMVSLLACTSRQQIITEEQPGTPPIILKKYPKNVILMIGDGMGISQITAGMYLNGNTLNLEKFPVAGLHKPYSYDNLITDSAAGATAFACGVKTYNKAVGVTADTVACTTILEMAENRGMATGLVVTSTIVHATPASFIAHVPHRRQYEAIATTFVDTQLEFFVGGGQKYFDQRISDDRNLVEELSNKGMQVTSYNQYEFENITIENQMPFAYFSAEEDPPKVREGRTYLPLASIKAAQHLDAFNEKGFFLMVEASQIDWGGHNNDSDYITSEMIDFDEAIGKVLEFAEADGETLVIVTGDHETGGYSINYGSTMSHLETAFTGSGHTGTMIPVFAYGPGAELFGGIYENTAIFDKMVAALQFIKTPEAG